MSDESVFFDVSAIVGALPLDADGDAPLPLSVAEVRSLLRLAKNGFALTAAPRGVLKSAHKNYDGAFTARLEFADAAQARAAGALLFTTVALVRVEEPGQGEGSPHLEGENPC